LQKPHPPLWLACSNRETIHTAARNGVGALAFAFVDPAEAAKWASEYYEIIKSEACVPIGRAVNANIAMATGFSVHHDEAEAIRRGQDGFQYFGYALGHHYVYGEHIPGVTNVWERFERARAKLPPAVGNGIGTPAQLIDRLRQYQDAGVDQVIFVQQAGRNTHADIIASLELFAAEVMPVLKADQAARDGRKQAELAPYIEAALKRKKWMRPLAPDAIPPVPAYGRTVVASEGTPGALSARRGGGINIPSEDPSETVPAAGDD
ncbi:MAG: LLM class flavin-dependent oxidoreductase, partial [Rhodopila sp.]